MSQISFADTNPATVESAVISNYEAIAQTTLYPGDPIRLFLESLAYIIATQNNVINFAGLQNLLAFAQGGHLDQVALMVGTTRLGDTASTCIQRFDLAQPLSFEVLIPAGTRVTSGDARATFATMASVTVATGETSVEVQVEALTKGSFLNGLVAGQINKLIDPIGYVVKTENVSMTTSGSDVESDARLRERAQLAPESFSCAGPTGAYEYQALQAHQDIVDVSVWSPIPGTVDIRPVLQGGELPTEEILALVRERVSAKDVRPLTDTVIVAAPEPVAYELKASWALQKTDSALAASITHKVTQAVEQYRLWQRSSPGRDINPTKLISLMEQAGARRVIVNFDYKVLAAKEVAQESSVNITFLGVEDE